MPKISVIISEEEKKEYDKRAEARDLNTSQWVRRCIRTSTQLWDTDGGFDRATFKAWFEQIEDVDLPDNDSSQGQTRSIDTEIHRLVLRELSTTEPTDLKEIQELVTEQIVRDALYELQQEQKIENIPGKGYQKK